MTAPLPHALPLTTREFGARRCQDVDILVAYVDANGGIADRRGVTRRFTSGALRAALTDGRVRAYGRSRLASPAACAAVSAAHRHGGVLSHRSAAAWWGWELLHPPAVPEVAVPRGARLDPGRRGCDVRHLLLGEGEVRDGATSPLRTVLDCAAVLPPADALAVADGALRHGAVEADELREAADLARGPGSAAKRRVAWAADGRADNPFESALRAVLLDVPGASWHPQWQITGEAFPMGFEFAARVDLADPDLCLVVEADSFEYHGGPAGLTRDAERRAELVARGWTVLPFTWDHVEGRPEWVRAVTEATVRTLVARSRRPQPC